MRSTRRSGSDAAAYSFYPTKNLGGIADGGAVVTDDDDLAATLRLLRAHGVTADYVHTRVSTNARLSDVAAAALRVGLRRLDVRQRAPPRDRGALPRRRARRCAGRPTTSATCSTSASRACPTATTFRDRVPFDTGVHYPRALDAAARLPGVRRGRRARKRSGGPRNAYRSPASPS